MQVDKVGDQQQLLRELLEKKNAWLLRLQERINVLLQKDIDGKISFDIIDK